MAVSDIILGDGVFAIGGTTVGLTRGGGSFAVEREYREIEADGDYGPVKGRIRKIRSVAKLTFSALELSPANLAKFFPATKVVSTAFQAAQMINDTADYSTVTWVGSTQGGKDVKITLENAINMENIEMDLTDKEEVVMSISFTATYLEGSRSVEPWKIDFLTTTTTTSGGTTP
jgi:hypothetical protein